MKPPKCAVCGVEHWGMEHVWPASNTATNVASNRIPVSNNASNRKVQGVRGRDAGAQSAMVEVVPEALAGTAGGVGEAVPAKKQRWARESYNAYQRDLMRKRRAKV